MFENQERYDEPGSWPFDVGRLVALDLHGLRGTRTRRRVIMVEFAAGAVLALGLGMWVTLGAGDVWWRLLGIWLIGIATNHFALTLCAMRLLLRNGALTTELAGLDLARELKRYGALSLCLVVPFFVAALALVQRRRRRHAP